jgi:hypothetical protein
LKSGIMRTAARSISDKRSVFLRTSLRREGNLAENTRCFSCCTAVHTRFFHPLGTVTLRVVEKSSKYRAILWLLSGQLDHEVLGGGIRTTITASDEYIMKQPAVDVKFDNTRRCASARDGQTCSQH